MEPARRLRVDMPAAFGCTVLLPILLDIGKSYPGLQLTLTFSVHVIELVKEGVDLAIRFGILEDSSDLVARKLTSHRWMICSTLGYLRKHGKPKTLADIAEHLCIVGFRRGRPLAWHVSEQGQTTRLIPPPSYQISDGEAMADATLAGMVLCQMPMSLFRKHIAALQLVSVLYAYTSKEIGDHAV